MTNRAFEECRSASRDGLHGLLRAMLDRLDDIDRDLHALSCPVDRTGVEAQVESVRVSCLNLRAPLPGMREHGLEPPLKTWGTGVVATSKTVHLPIPGMEKALPAGVPDGQGATWTPRNYLSRLGHERKGSGRRGKRGFFNPLTPLAGLSYL